MRNIVLWILLALIAGCQRDTGQAKTDPAVDKVEEPSSSGANTSIRKIGQIKKN